MTLTLEDRLSRLTTFHREGRIIRGAWTSEKEDRELACLLAAFSPEVAKRQDASACPKNAMPPWLAHITSSLVDFASEAAWPQVVARYIAVLPTLVRLSPEKLVRLDYQTRAIAVRKAQQRTTNASVLRVMDDVLRLLDWAAEGREVSKEDWALTRDAAKLEAAKWETEWVAAEGAEAAAAWTETEVATAAASAMQEEAYAAAWAASGSWHQISDSWLTAWEKACKVVS